jgi:hypothetical protein
VFVARGYGDGATRHEIPRAPARREAEQRAPSPIEAEDTTGRGSARVDARDWLSTYCIQWKILFGETVRFNKQLTKQLQTFWAGSLQIPNLV